jgi:hypothetical protein
VRKTIAACVVTALAVGGGSATAASLITSKDIKDGTIAARDIKKGSITVNRLSKGSQARLRKAGTPGTVGAQGAAGKNGANGPAGPSGAKGEKGDSTASAAGVGDNTAVVANATTAPNSDINNLRIVPVKSTATGDTGPDNANPGSELVSVQLPAGTYTVAGTAQFLTNNSNDNDEYGVARLFVNGASQGSQIFSPEIPAQPILAQTGASIFITVPAGGAKVALNAVARGAEQGAVFGGANILVARVASEL